MLNLLTSASLRALFPCFPIALFPVDVLYSDWCIRCYGLVLVDAFLPFEVLVNK